MSNPILTNPEIVERDRMITATFRVTDSDVIKFTLSHDKPLRGYVAQVYGAQVETKLGVSYERVRDIAGVHVWKVADAPRFSIFAMRTKFYSLLKSGHVEDLVALIYHTQFADLGTAE